MVYTTAAKRLTTQVPPVVSGFRVLEPESCIRRLSANAKSKQFKQLTEGCCSDSMDTCIMAPGNEGDIEL